MSLAMRPNEVNTEVQYDCKAKLTILKEAARTLNYLTENNLSLIHI